MLSSSEEITVDQLSEMHLLNPEDFRQADKLFAEVEEGSREYKYKLTSLSKEQLTHRISQLTWRLNEGLPGIGKGKA
jgi:hypothetical protein